MVGQLLQVRLLLRQFLLQLEKLLLLALLDGKVFVGLLPSLKGIPEQSGDQPLLVLTEQINRSRLCMRRISSRGVGREITLLP